MLEILPILGIVFAVLAIIFTLAIVYAINEDFLLEDYLECEQETQEETPKSLKKVFLKLILPFRDMEYLKWLLASFSMNIAMRMMVKSLTPYFTYVLELQGGAFIYYLLAAVPFAVMGFIVWQKHAKEKGLKSTFLISTSIISVALGLTLVLVFIKAPLVKQIVAFFLIAAAISSLVGGFILPNPIISELSDQIPEELKEGDQQVSAGNYFGTYLFMLNIANALGDVILGWLMRGENAVDPLIIGLLFPVCAVFYIIAVWIFRSSSLTK